MRNTSSSVVPDRGKPVTKTMRDGVHSSPRIAHCTGHRVESHARRTSKPKRTEKEEQPFMLVAGGGGRSAALGGRGGGNRREFSLLAFVLRLLKCDQTSDAGGAPKLTCYYDAAPDIVERQLEFRRRRKMDRDSSFNSLASLGAVIDYIGRRIEVKLDHTFLSGKIEQFDETYHLVAFDNGTKLWFSLTLDGLTDSGHAQQVLRDEDGGFSTIGPNLQSRLI